MGRRQKVSDGEIIAAYQRHGTMRRAGDALGITASAICQRMRKIEADTTRKDAWTAEQDAKLAYDYSRYRDERRVGDLAHEIGRSYGSVVTRMARLKKLARRFDTTHPEAPG